MTKPFARNPDMADRTVCGCQFSALHSEVIRASFGLDSRFTSWVFLDFGRRGALPESGILLATLGSILTVDCFMLISTRWRRDSPGPCTKWSPRVGGRCQRHANAVWSHRQYRFPVRRSPVPSALFKAACKSPGQHQSLSVGRALSISGFTTALNNETTRSSEKSQVVLRHYFKSVC